MFFSTYLPVNIKRKNAAIYTSTNYYPVDLLVVAERALRDNIGINTEVIIEDNIVTFAEHTEIQWTVPDVYLACEALHTAEANNFSFFTVNNTSGQPHLFVSKAFKSHRIIVNALTFESVIVTKPLLLKRIASMIDKTFDRVYCNNVFDVVNDLEHSRNRYLDAIIVDRDTEDECMIVNPITSMFAEENTIYERYYIEDYRTLLNDPNAEVENIDVIDDMFYRRDRVNFPPVPKVFAQHLVELYDKLLAKKCNYVGIRGEDYDTHYYVSTNWRYFVNARTFECAVITNTFIKKCLQEYVSRGTNPTQDLMMCWMIASGDAR